MSEKPPSHYRIEERGRRLIVIDNMTGKEATGADGMPSSYSGPVIDHRTRTEGELFSAHPGHRPVVQASRAASPAGRDKAAAPLLVLQPKEAGGKTFRTQKWFDSQAPRTVTLDQAAHEKIRNLIGTALVAMVLGLSVAFLVTPGFTFIMVFFGFLAVRNALPTLAPRLLVETIGARIDSHEY